MRPAQIKNHILRRGYSYRVHRRHLTGEKLWWKVRFTFADGRVEYVSVTGRFRRPTVSAAKYKAGAVRAEVMSEFMTEGDIPASLPPP